MKNSLVITLLLSAAITCAQDLTQNYRKLILNSPNNVSLFQSNSTNGIWASGMIVGDRWGVFEDATSTHEHFTILSGGNVGIGTSSPSRLLELNATQATHALFKGSFSGIQGIQVERASGDNIRLVTNYAGYGGGLESSSKLRFAVDGNGINSPSMIVDELGRVGIGTASPYDRLEVRDGRLRISDGSDRMFLAVDNQNSTSSIAFGDDLSDRLDLNFDFWNGTTQDITIMSLLANGRVGIGTTTPDAELAVNGDVHAKEVKVDLIGWPDYVFDDDYDLPTLQEVEKHIKQRGHLINIPSAKEVEENGVQLGEMNKLLLEKIEELTLYIIVQEKRIKILEQKTDEYEKSKE